MMENAEFACQSTIVLPNELLPNYDEFDRNSIEDLVYLELR